MTTEPAGEPELQPVIVRRSRFFDGVINAVEPSPFFEAANWLTVYPTDLFEVLADRDKSEGRGARYRVGLYTTLSAAWANAAGHGVQGGAGQVNLLARTVTEVHATNDDGASVAVGTTVEYVAVSWKSRLTTKGTP